MKYFIRYATEFMQEIIIAVTENQDIIFIPIDIRNIDFHNYQAWLDLGNTPEEWQPESETE